MGSRLPLFAAAALALLCAPAHGQSGTLVDQLPAEQNAAIADVLAGVRSGWIDTTATTFDFEGLDAALAEWEDRPDWLTAFDINTPEGERGAALGIDVAKLPQMEVTAAALQDGAFADALGSIWVCATCMTPQSPLDVNVNIGVPAGVPGALFELDATVIGPRLPTSDQIRITNVSASSLWVTVQFPVPAMNTISLPHHNFGSIAAWASEDNVIHLSPGASYSIRPFGNSWVLARQ